MPDFEAGLLFDPSVIQKAHITTVAGMQRRMNSEDSVVVISGQFDRNGHLINLHRFDEEGHITEITTYENGLLRHEIRYGIYDNNNISTGLDYRITYINNLPATHDVIYFDSSSSKIQIKHDFQCQYKITGVLTMQCNCLGEPSQDIPPKYHYCDTLNIQLDTTGKILGMTDLSFYGSSHAFYYDSLGRFKIYYGSNEYYGFKNMYSLGVIYDSTGLTTNTVPACDGCQSIFFRYKTTN